MIYNMILSKFPVAIDSSCSFVDFYVTIRGLLSMVG
jgi:hypothetical protein